VGEAIAASGLAREEVFVTTKLWNAEQGYDSTLAACEKSLGRLGLDQVDLYLIHWPMPSEDRYLDTWRAFEKIREEGRARSIGSPTSASRISSGSRPRPDNARP
jgi:2,5-diketo-D-gluconate reductase A